jgi:histidyl-tRNA synthetase
MGVERVALLLDAQQFQSRPDLFIAAHGSAAQDQAFLLMCQLQRRGVRVEMEYEVKSLKSQMRRADKFNSRFTLIIGEDELARGSAVLKNMASGSQEDVGLQADQLARILAG